jgi:hypothetical protein
MGIICWFRYLLYCIRRIVLDCLKPSTDSVTAELLMDATRGKMDLMAENAFLRQQLLVLRRTVKRPQPTSRDRFLLVLLASKVRAWKPALLIVQPETLLR